MVNTRPLLLPLGDELPDERGCRVTAMVESHYDAVWRALRRLGVPDRSVDDGAQRVFLVAARKVDAIRPGEERPYLMGIALRVAADARRAIVRHGDVAEADARVADTTEGADVLVDRKRARVLLDAIVVSMPTDLREAFVLFELEGMTAPEVAAAMGVPLGTATSRLRRARELFREKVARHAASTGSGGKR